MGENITKMASKNNLTIELKTVFYLKMDRNPQIELDQNFPLSTKLLPKPVSTAYYRSIYHAVGSLWNWNDRLVLSDQTLYQRINGANVEIFEAYFNDELCGYAEFVIENDFVELLYFGLLPSFIGKGLGNLFIAWCVQKAWSYQKKWIQLNTCTLDHPNALSTYKKAGFVCYKTETENRFVRTI